MTTARISEGNTLKKRSMLWTIVRSMALRFSGRDRRNTAMWSCRSAERDGGRSTSVVRVICLLHMQEGRLHGEELSPGRFQPLLNYRQPVGAPKWLAIDDDEWRAEKAAGDRVCDRASQAGLCLLAFDAGPECRAVKSNRRCRVGHCIR